MLLVQAYVNLGEASPQDAEFIERTDERFHEAESYRMRGGC
jgi:hypothetical protein